MHKLFCRPVPEPRGVLLSLERSKSVNQHCMGLIEKAQYIFSSPRQACPPSPISQHCFTTCSEHNSPVLYIFRACLDRRSWKYKAPFLYFGISHSDTRQMCYACAMHYTGTAFCLWSRPRWLGTPASWPTYSPIVMIPKVHDLDPATGPAFCARQIQHGL